MMQENYTKLHLFSFSLSFFPPFIPFIVSPSRQHLYIYSIYINSDVYYTPISRPSPSHWGYILHPDEA